MGVWCRCRRCWCGCRCRRWCRSRHTILLSQLLPVLLSATLLAPIWPMTGVAGLGNLKCSTFALGVLCVLCGLLLLSLLSLPRPRSLVLTMFMPLSPALLGY